MNAYLDEISDKAFFWRFHTLSSKLFFSQKEEKKNCFEAKNK
jgi:hypothetical protein